MRILKLMGTIAWIGFLSQAAYGSSIQGCEMTGVSGLWPGADGVWFGSSRMEWRDCEDGNNYTAICSHQGSGENMDSCTCIINDNKTYEKSCQGLVSSADLSVASVQCCGFFKTDSELESQP